MRWQMLAEPSHLLAIAALCFLSPLLSLSNRLHHLLDTATQRLGGRSWRKERKRRGKEERERVSDGAGQRRRAAGSRAMRLDCFSTSLHTRSLASSSLRDLHREMRDGRRKWSRASGAACGFSCESFRTHPSSPASVPSSPASCPVTQVKHTGRAARLREPRLEGSHACEVARFHGRAAGGCESARSLPSMLSVC